MLFVIGGVSFALFLVELVLFLPPIYAGLCQVSEAIDGSNACFFFFCTGTGRIFENRDDAVFKNASGGKKKIITSPPRVSFTE